MAAQLQQLYEAYGAQVLRRARYLLQDEQEAWDATQEVFLKVDRAWQDFEGRSHERTWLLRITTNHCLNRLRARKVRQGSGLVAAEDLDREVLGPPGADEAQRARALLVRQMLSHFDAETQALAVSYWVDETSQEELALDLGCSVPTLRRRLQRFLDQARRVLAGQSPRGAAPARGGMG